jgi:hypothetical protein
MQTVMYMVNILQFKISGAALLRHPRRSTCFSELYLLGMNKARLTGENHNIQGTTVMSFNSKTLHKGEDLQTCYSTCYCLHSFMAASLSPQIISKAFFTCSSVVISAPTTNRTQNTPFRMQCVSKMSHRLETRS